MILKNLYLKNKKLTTAFGEFTFDGEGKADIPDEQANKLLELKGYERIDKEDEQKAEVKPAEKTEEVTKTIDKVTVEDIKAKNVPMLKKFAKDNNIEVEGLTKKEELVDAILKETELN